MLSLSSQKESSCWGNFWHGCTLSHWHLLHNCHNNAACPQCLGPSIAEIAEACGQTMQLARDVSCPHMPRPLGLAVNKVSPPAMSKPLWRNRYLACCTQISSLPAMSCALIGQDCWGLLYIRLACPQCWSPCGVIAIWLAVRSLLARLQCLMPSLAKTAGACCA